MRLLPGFLMKIFVAIVVCAAVTATAAMADKSTGPGRAPPTGATVDPITLYGERLEFTVLRNGSRVGDHLVTFRRDGSRLDVVSRFDIAVRFLFVTAYRYTYESRAAWENGRLVSLVATIDDDGERAVVRARRIGGRLRVSGPGGMIWSPSDVIPTNHWNPAVLDRRQVLNTLTGALNRVSIADLGTTSVRTEDGARSARHFRYSGDLEVESWYDVAGRWIKLRFLGKDGSTIEYVCRRCGPSGYGKRSQ